MASEHASEHCFGTSLRDMPLDYARGGEVVIADERKLAKLVGEVYEAAADITLWPRVFFDMAQACGATSATSVTHRWGKEVNTYRSSWNLDLIADGSYDRHYHSQDVWAARARWKPAGLVCTSESVCRLEELETLEIYNDFLVPYNIVHGMFGIVENNPAHWVSVSFFKGPAAGEFENADLQILNFLIPHLQRAFKLHFELSEMKARSEGVEAALDMLSLGVVLVGAAGNVVRMNRAAEEVFRAKDGLFVKHGEVSAGLPSESVRLRGMMAAAAQTGSGRGVGAGGTMLVSRLNGRPLSLTVSALREFDASLAERPTAVVFISDPERHAALPADVLRRSYGLTQAEARLALILLEGRSLKVAAELCGTTHNTAKSQLKSIFSKTQVRRQSELIRLLLGSAV